MGLRIEDETELPSPQSNLRFIIVPVEFSELSLVINFLLRITPSVGKLISGAEIIDVTGLIEAGLTTCDSPNGILIPLIEPETTVFTPNTPSDGVIVLIIFSFIVIFFPIFNSYYVCIVAGKAVAFIIKSGVVLAASPPH